MSQVVDLRSDTVTKPTPTMRRAMAEAEVGDDVYREDPTVLKLEMQAAEFLGKAAALFVPTGTMGNLASIMSHCWIRGQEILVGDQSHIFLYEQGGAAQLAGVQSRTVTTKADGTFDLQELEEKIRNSSDVHQPQTGLICLENTHNMCGGAVLPIEYVEKVCRLGKFYNIPVHMDGARIVNAAIKLGIPVASLVKECDSVSMCLSKSLGAPMGTIVAGSEEFIARVLRCRKLLGGGMRQVGIVAAAGIVALNTMVERIVDDHKNALLLARAIYDQRSTLVAVDLNRVHTNMVMLHFDTKRISSGDFIQRLKEVLSGEKEVLGHDVIVKISSRSPQVARCVIHADISSDDVTLVIKKISYVIKEFETNLK